MKHCVIVLLSLLAQALSQEFTCELSGTPGVCVEDLYPYAYDCNKYWQCTSGCISYLRDCPEFLHFMAENKTCVSQVDAMCIETTTVAPITTTVLTTQTTETIPSTTVTTQSTTIFTGEPTTPIPANPSMFFVGKSESYQGIDRVVDFDVLVTDRREDFNMDTNQFVAPSSGIYFLSLSCGVLPNTDVNCRIEDTLDNSIANVRRYSTAHTSQDILSRDVIVYLAEGQAQLIDLRTPNGFYSSDHLETSFLGFSLHDSMDLVSAFSVAINVPTNALGVIDFNVIFTNENNDFDNTVNGYTAPRTGVYLFSLSAGLNTQQPARVQMLVNGVETYELWRDHNDHNEDDTISRSVLMNLQAGDLVQYSLESGQLYSNSRHQTSFSGFYYNHRFLVDPVAWFVSHTRGWVSTLGANLSPVDYDDITVNLRNPYDATTHQVVIPEAGFYYVHFGVGSEREFVIREKNVDIALVKRDNQGTEILVNLVRDATDFFGVDTLARGAIYDFNAGDVVYTQAAPGTAFYGDNTRGLTYFMGLMLYSTE